MKPTYPKGVQKPTRIIQEPSKKMYDYEALNADAARAFGVPWPYGKNAIVIDKNMHGRLRRRTEVHEMVEKHFMDKGMKYWPAHKLASKVERKVK
jgi:hypothetical protein